MRKRSCAGKIQANLKPLITAIAVCGLCFVVPPSAQAQNFQSQNGTFVHGGVSFNAPHQRQVQLSNQLNRTINAPRQKQAQLSNQLNRTINAPRQKQVQLSNQLNRTINDATQVVGRTSPVRIVHTLPTREKPKQVQSLVSTIVGQPFNTPQVGRTSPVQTVHTLPARAKSQSLFHTKYHSSSKHGSYTKKMRVIQTENRRHVEDRVEAHKRKTRASM